MRPDTHILGRRAPGPPVATRTLLAVTAGLLAAALLGGLLRRPWQRRRVAAGTAARAARRVRQAEGVLAFSVLTDSAMEHFRGNYGNRLMYLPPASAAMALADALSGGGSRTSAAGAVGLGATGLAYHSYSVLSRRGGLSWHNLFYAAPIGAPGSLLLAGIYGRLASRIASGWQVGADGRLLSFITAGGIFGTLAEVWLLHFRGAYQNPAMYIPIIAMPLAAVALLLAAAAPRRAPLGVSRVLLKGNAVMGLVGTGFHVYGVSRNMGGWRNWTQNLFAGPPIPAPFGYVGVALAGLGALELLESDNGAPGGER